MTGQSEQGDPFSSRFRSVRMMWPPRRIGAGLPRPLAIALSAFVLVTMGTLALLAMALSLIIAIIATPFLLATLSVRRALRHRLQRDARMGDQRRNVVVRERESPSHNA